MQAQTEPKLHPETANMEFEQKLSQSDLQPWRVIWRLTWNPSGF